MNMQNNIVVYRNHVRNVNIGRRREMTEFNGCRRYRSCKHYWDIGDIICILCRNESRFKQREINASNEKFQE